MLKAQEMTGPAFKIASVASVICVSGVGIYSGDYQMLAKGVVLGGVLLGLAYYAESEHAIILAKFQERIKTALIKTS